MAKRRFGILTSGGDCPGLNAVIRAVVEVAVPSDAEVLGIEDAFSGLLGGATRHGHQSRWLGLDDVRGILSRGGTILGTTNRGDPFRYPVREGDHEVETDRSDEVVASARAHGLEGVIVVGGDGSMKIAQRFLEKGLPVVGVPKTIDNDLAATDQTFGFDTAVGIAMESIDRLRDTAESHDRVMLVEVMGREAGFIALHAGIAGGADAILLPEIPYRVDALVRMVERRIAAGQSYAVVVVSEGAQPVGGVPSIVEHRPGGMPRHGGAAMRLEAELGSRVGAEIRSTVLGHVQRGGSPSAVDRVLGTRYGIAAAELALAGGWGGMVALRGDAIVTVPIADAIRDPKRVDPSGAWVRAARRAGVSFGDET